MRLEGLDRLRGLAIVLMVLDHLLVVFGHGLVSDLTRETITRASLPLFCLVMGSLAVGRPVWPRAGILVAWGLVATAVGFPIGIGQPDILLLLAVALVLVGASFSVGWFWTAFVVALLQPTTWPVPWSGYQPGTVIALTIAGALIGRRSISGVGDRLPRFLALPGEFPLEIYIGHLVGLFVLVRAVGG